jgi:hypothetical protein
MQSPRISFCEKTRFCFDPFDFRRSFQRRKIVVEFSEVKRIRNSENSDSKRIIITISIDITSRSIDWIGRNRKQATGVTTPQHKHIQELKRIMIPKD